MAPLKAAEASVAANAIEETRSVGAFMEYCLNLAHRKLKAVLITNKGAWSSPQYESAGMLSKQPEPSHNRA